MPLLLADNTASLHVPCSQSIAFSSGDSCRQSELLLVEPDPVVLESRTLVLSQFRYHVIAAMSQREVVCRSGSRICFAVVSTSVGTDNLRAFAEIIRRQWKSARILVVGDAARMLADELYDEAIHTRSSSDEILIALRKLSAPGVGNGDEPVLAGSEISATRFTTDLVVGRQEAPGSDPTKAPCFERERLVILHDVPAGERNREKESEGSAHSVLNDPFADEADSKYLSRGAYASSREETRCVQ